MMGYDLEIRFKCRAEFEIYSKKLSDISKNEGVPISTLSDWKNDDREEYGGIWIKGSRKDELTRVSRLMQEEITNSDIYKNVKDKLEKRHGVSKEGQLELNNMVALKGTPEEIQAKVEAESLILGALGISFFDNALMNNAILSQTVLNNQVKKDITKIKQADIKASSEIVKIAKESKFGKDPETVNQFTFQVGKLEYTEEEIEGMDADNLEKLIKNIEQKIINDGILDAELIENKKGEDEE